MTKQSLIILARPDQFFLNPVTSDNAFQDRSANISNASEQALEEHRKAETALKEAGVSVLCYNSMPGHPDGIFPNNSFSLHETSEGLKAIIYPMSPGRQGELPEAFLSFLKKISEPHFYDLRAFEREEKYLEGTGALNFSPDEKFVYMGRSYRANEDVLTKVGEILDIPSARQFVFDMKDPEGNAIYHTNVISWVGRDLFVLCPDVIPEGSEKEKLLQHAAELYPTVLFLNYTEIEAFAGNALEVLTRSGDPLLTLSTAAFGGLKPEHRLLLKVYYGEAILPLPIPTIEKLGGGSVRCLQAKADVSEKTMKQIQQAFGKAFPAE